MIEGLTVLEGPRTGRLSPHKFSLPPGFPADRFASKWVEDGPEVIEAQQKQIIDRANVAADGWTVYFQLKAGAPVVEAGGEAAKPPKRESVKRVVGKKTFVLMYRPKALQQAINNIYADQSRALVCQEVKGESAAAAPDDPGILTNADLRQFRGLGLVSQDEGAEYIPPGAGSQPTQVQQAATVSLE